MPFNQGMQRAQGDPGFFSFIGKALTTVARAIPGPIGAIAGALGGSRPQPTALPTLFQQQPPVFRAPVPGAIGAAQRFLPGGATGFVDCPPRKRTRRIDPLNMKALRRANRRQAMFLKAVDRTLATMPTKASVSRRRKQAKG